MATPRHLEGLEPADYLFANINRNIIPEDMDRYTAAPQARRHNAPERILQRRHPRGLANARQSPDSTRYDSKESNRWVAVRLLKNY